LFYLIDLFEFKNKIMKKLLLSLLFIGSSSLFAQTWTEQNTNTVNNSYIGDISIVDANVVWAMVQRTTATNHQIFSKTTDGGTTWTSGAINVGNPTGLAIANIVGVDANTAWASVFPTAAGLATQGVYKTTNGGSTWTRQATAAFTAASFVNFVYFWDANNGVCMGDKRLGYYEIYTTTNGGTNWVRTPSANIATNVAEWGYTGKYFVAGNTIWFGTDGGELMRSTDKGLNWTKIVTPIPDFGGGAVATSAGEFAFANDSNGVIQQTLEPTAFYVTTDGGATWTLTTQVGMYWGSIAYAGPSMLVSGGSTVDNFGSSYSLNNGVTWFEMDTDSHTCLEFKDATTGWGGGFAVAGIGGAFKFNPSLSTADFTTSKFTVYPNPANNIVTIAAPGFESYQLTVTDVSGKVVMEKSLNGVENTLDISALSTGAYFFTLNSGDKKETVKIIKN